MGIALLSNAMGFMLAAAVLSWLATGVTLKVLRHYQIMDNPNARSSHTLPTPRGGGWGIMVAVIAALFMAASVVDDLRPALWLGGAIALLMLVSWLDDLRPQPALLRFGIQVIAVAMGFQALPDAPILQGWVPMWVEYALVGIGWLWFINLYNFMDGIDGISGVETLCIAMGALGIALVVGNVPVMFLSASIAGAALGFLIWNWHPAKLFLGDVGSIPLGFILGFVLLSLAASGYVFAPAILALYYVFDATYTLIRRMVQGKEWHEAHREHFYQIAAAKVGHARVALTIAVGNVALIGCAWACLTYGWVMLLPAVAVAAALCWHLWHLSQKP